MALIGNLKDIKLPSLIQLNCLDKESNFKGEVRTFRRSDKVL